MKKFLNSLIFVLIFAILAGAFVSCGGNGGSEISGDVFSDSLKITEKNLTASVYHEYDGDSMTAVIKIVDGVQRLPPTLKLPSRTGISPRRMRRQTRLSSNT